MPTAEGDIIETGVSWDHDTGEIIVSTRRKSIKNKLLKMGLKPSIDEDDGYTTFRTNENTLKVSFRGRRTLSEDKRRALGRRLANARKTA